MGSCTSRSLEAEVPVKQINTGGNHSSAVNFGDSGLATGVLLQKPSSEYLNMVEPREIIEDEMDMRFKSFKQFDVVIDHSDHHYSNPERIKGVHAVKNPTKDWAKRIQYEWKVLEKDLPETIFVRIYEDRMDILRAVIVGSSGTPYHDGLFFFDVHFPQSYPNSPPLVHYHSGGLRLNPNLYACGKICLSLLNTWYGSGCEKWNPSHSTILQVLVSIQSLVLNAKPYFNEPGYSMVANTRFGKRKSLAYNEHTFLLSCKTMLYSLRKPPKHFEDFIAGHFCKQGRTILMACRAYMAGVEIGCNIDEMQAQIVQVGSKRSKSGSSTFETQMRKVFEDLLKEFAVKGVDCAEFLTQKIKAGALAKEQDSA